MIISEEDLKCRILRGQVEVLDDVTNELGARYEKALFAGKEELADTLRTLQLNYTKYRADLKKEIKENQTRI